MGSTSTAIGVVTTTRVGVRIDRAATMSTSPATGRVSTTPALSNHGPLSK